MPKNERCPLVELLQRIGPHVRNHPVEQSPSMVLNVLVLLSQEGRAKVIHADSQADVEMFRQDTVHHQESVEVY